MKELKLVILLAIVLSMLNACGGGGGNTTTTSSTNLNGDLTGKIFIGSDFDGPWIMDMTTGHYIPIPGVDWDDPADFPDLADFSAYPARDGAEFVETVRKCVDTGTLSFDDCFIFHDQQGGIVSRFEVPEGTDGPAKMSLDREFIAVPYSTTDVFGYLRIYSRNGGTALSESDETLHSARDFDWLPDNSLAYSSGQTIYLTGVGSAVGTPLVKFPDEVGRPSQLAVSPDGTQLAFTLVTTTNIESSHGTTWVLNIDGSQLRQLTDAPGPNDPAIITDDPLINFPTWSPDGRWILVVESTSIEPVAYAVPSDGEKVFVTQDEPTTAVPILSYFLETLGIDDRPPSNFFGIEAGNMVWLP